MVSRIILFFIFLFIPSEALADPVSAAVAAAVTGFGVTATGAITFSFTAAAIGAGLSVLSQVLTPKPKQPNLSSFASIKSTGAAQQVRQAVTERNILYGEQRLSGGIVYAGVTDDNKYLHLIITLASHEVEEIGEVIINDVSVPDDDLDVNGFVQSGRYADIVRIKKNLGSTTQVADADAISDIPEWTSSHRLQGIAYMYIRCEWDRDVFATGIPNFSAYVKGKKVLDTRDSTTRWTPNIALMARDYLTDDFGFGASSSVIYDTQTDSAANTCEEYVTSANLDLSVTEVDTTNDILTLSGNQLQYQTADKVQLISGTIGGLSTSTDYYVIVVQRQTTPRIKLATSLANCLAGTAIDITSGTTGTLRKIAEPRYFGGGIIKTNSEKQENFKEILYSMAGQAVYAGGVWRLLAGEYQTPTISFDENDLAGGITVQTKVSKNDRFNLVQGIYLSPLNNGNSADYPVVQNSTYQTQDGEVLKKNIDLPFTQMPQTAQRVAKIYLERMRQEITFTAKFKLTAFKVQVGDNFYFSFDRYGWSSKIFEVISWSLTNDGITPVIEMTCRENASAVYDWNNGEETQVDPAPNTSLSNPYIVPVVGGLSLDSILVDTQSLDKTFKVLASWDLSENEFVLSGGFYEIEYKKSTDPDTSYRSAAKVDGSVSEQEIAQLEPDVLYDIRIFAYNNLGVRSNETLIEDFKVGTTVTTDTEDWENETIAARDGQDWETDSLTSEDWES